MEVSDLIDKIKVNKAIDTVSSLTCKNDNLALIFGYSIKQAIFPEKLKTRLILNVHKGESKFACSNNRPLSILPLFSKIYEHLMYARLIDLK